MHQSLKCLVGLSVLVLEAQALSLINCPQFNDCHALSKPHVLTILPKKRVALSVVLNFQMFTQSAKISLNTVRFCTTAAMESRACSTSGNIEFSLHESHPASLARVHRTQSLLRDSSGHAHGGGRKSENVISKIASTTCVLDMSIICSVTRSTICTTCGLDTSIICVLVRWPIFTRPWWGHVDNMLAARSIASTARFCNN